MEDSRKDDVIKSLKTQLKEAEKKMKKSQKEIEQLKIAIERAENKEFRPIQRDR